MKRHDQKQKNLGGVYDAFVSYSHADCKDIASPIQNALQNIGKPWYKELSTNIKVYRDQTNLNASPGFWPDIEQALKESRHLILLASPEAANSRWIKKEIEVWIEMATTESGLQRIFIVLCDGEIVWNEHGADFDWQKTNCLPAILTGVFKNEPLWIDLRSYIEEQDKKKLIRHYEFSFSEQLAKIIGAIIKRPPFEIVSKELQRVKKLRNIYSLAIIILFAIAGLAIFFYAAQRKTNTLLKQTNNRLSEQKERSDSLRKLAEFELKRFKIEEFKRNIRNGTIFLDAKEYCLAKTAFDSASTTARRYPGEAREDSLSSYLERCRKACP